MLWSTMRVLLLIGVITVLLVAADSDSLHANCLKETLPRDPCCQLHGALTARQLRSAPRVYTP